MKMACHWVSIAYSGCFSKQSLITFLGTPTTTVSIFGMVVPETMARNNSCPVGLHRRWHMPVHLPGLSCTPGSTFPETIHGKTIKNLAGLPTPYMYSCSRQRMCAAHRHGGASSLWLTLVRIAFTEVLSASRSGLGLAAGIWCGGIIYTPRGLMARAGHTW